MIPEVKNNLAEIVKACKQIQVESLYVFGSAAREKDYSKKSDIDFLYTMTTDDNGLPRSDYDYLT